MARGEDDGGSQAAASRQSGMGWAGISVHGLHGYRLRTHLIHTCWVAAARAVRTRGPAFQSAGPSCHNKTRTALPGWQT